MSEYNATAYAALAPAYDEAGFANYAGYITPEILTFLQQNGWLGRRILDLGCGTGQSTAALAERGFNVTGVDQSAEMLGVARMRVQGTGYLADTMQDNILTMDYLGSQDLVLCIGNVVNDFRNLREVETLFRKAFAALEPDRRFVFDMLTLRGLATYLTGEKILDISDRLYITAQGTFTYDTMSLRQTITLFHRGKDEAWQRTNAYLTLHSFPVERLTKLLETIGFKVFGAFTTHFEEFDLYNDTEGRTIVIAEKPA
jgi:SAM-dependent methyltransferase